MKFGLRLEAQHEMLRLHGGALFAIFQNFCSFLEQALRDLLEQVTQTECAGPSDSDALGFAILCSRLLPDQITHHVMGGFH